MEYAPTTREELSDLLGGFDCYDKQYCTQNRQRKNNHHHDYPKNVIARLGLTALRKDKERQTEMCVCKHCLIHKMFEYSVTAVYLKERGSDE